MSLTCSSFINYSFLCSPSSQETTKEKAALAKQITTLETQFAEELNAAADDQQGVMEELVRVQGELDVCRQDLAVAHIAAEERLKQDAMKEEAVVEQVSCDEIFRAFHSGKINFRVLYMKISRTTPVSGPLKLPNWKLSWRRKLPARSSCWERSRKKETRRARSSRRRTTNSARCARSCAPL